MPPCSAFGRLQALLHHTRVPELPQGTGAPAGVDGSAGNLRLFFDPALAGKALAAINFDKPIPRRGTKGLTSGGGPAYSPPSRTRLNIPPTRPRREQHPVHPLVCAIAPVVGSSRTLAESPWRSFIDGNFLAQVTNRMPQLNQPPVNTGEAQRQSPSPRCVPTQTTCAAPPGLPPCPTMRRENTPHHPATHGRHVEQVAGQQANAVAAPAWQSTRSGH